MRQSEDSRHQIQEGIADFDDYYRNRAHRKYASIDAVRTPQDVADDVAYQQMRDQLHMLPQGQTRSRIDKYGPAVAIIGLLIIALLLGGVGEWLIDAGVL